MTKTYVSDLIFHGIRQKTPEEAETHLKRLKRAMERMGIKPRKPPKKD